MAHSQPTSTDALLRMWGSWTLHCFYVRCIVVIFLYLNLNQYHWSVVHLRLHAWRLQNKRSRPAPALTEQSSQVIRQSSGHSASGFADNNSLNAQPATSGQWWSFYQPLLPLLWISAAVIHCLAVTHINLFSLISFCNTAVFHSRGWKVMFTRVGQYVEIFQLATFSNNINQPTNQQPSYAAILVQVSVWYAGESPHKKTSSLK